MRRLPLFALLGAAVAVATASLAAANAGRGGEVPNLQLRVQAATVLGRPGFRLFPSWEFPKDARYGEFANCFAAHSTGGLLLPQDGQRDIDYRDTRPPFPGAPTGGDWRWQCYALGGSGLKYPDPSFCTKCNYSDYEVASEGKFSGPATIRVYLLSEVERDKAYEVLDETSAVVRFPPLSKPRSEPGKKPPTKKPGTKPPAKKPGTKPTGKKSGKRFTFTARLSGKPVIGAERLFASYQGSQAHAQGSLLSAAPVGAEADLVDASGSVSLVHDYSAFPDERYSFQLDAINNSFTKTFSNGRALRIGVKVTASSFSGCPVGRTGVVVVSDLTNGDGFEVSLCGIRLVWVDDKGASVAVVIRAA